MKGGNRNLVLLVAGVVIVALVSLVVILLGDDDAQDRWKENPDITRNEEPGKGKGTENEPFNIPANDPVERLNRFKEWAQYPPHSRPLTAGNVDLIKPYDAEKTSLGIISKPGKNCKQKPSGGVECETAPVISNIKCKVTPESSISVGKKDFNISVYCNNEKGERLALTNLKAKMERWFNRKKTRSLPPTHIGDNGENGDTKAGDKIYNLQFRTGNRDWGQMLVTADFEVNGMKHSQRGDFYSTPHTVATFAKSGVRDAIEDGSLYVYIPVTIVKAGYYEFQANLQEAGGDKRFISHTTNRKEYKVGATNVRLEFFGKIIKDANIEGPFKIREMRGKRHNSPVSKAEVEKSRREGKSITRETTQPLWEYINPLHTVHTTDAYTVSQFSDKEYESDEKKRRVKLLNSLTK